MSEMRALSDAVIVLVRAAASRASRSRLAWLQQSLTRACFAFLRTFVGG
jgi:hypothetical protein